MTFPRRREPEAGAGREEGAGRFLLFFFFTSVVSAHAVDNLRELGRGTVNSFQRAVALHDRPFFFAALVLANLLGSLLVYPFIYWGLLAFVRKARGEPSGLPFTGRSPRQRRAAAPNPPRTPRAPLLSDADRAAMRRILLGWSDLSAGDVSVLDHAMQTARAEIATVSFCPNDRLWGDLERLGWARAVEVPEPLASLSRETRMYALTERGRRLLPDFRRRYDLVFGTSYAPLADQRGGGSPTDRFQ